MIEQLAKNMAIFYANKKIVPQEDTDIYAYGFELLLSTFCNILLVLCVGLILDLVLESIFFMLSFILMRTLGGGYHAKTHAGCICTFTAVFILFAIIIKYLPSDARVLYIALCTLIASLIIWKVAPVAAPNNPMTGKRKARLRNICLLVTCCYMALAVIVCLGPIQQGSVMVSMFSGFFAVSISMAVAAKIAHRKEGISNV